jgi:hypothetical protein
MFRRGEKGVIVLIAIILGAGFTTTARSQEDTWDFSHCQAILPLCGSHDAEENCLCRCRDIMDCEMEECERHKAVMEQ